MKSCHFYRIAQCSSKNSMTLSSFSITFHDLCYFPWLSRPGKWSSEIPWLSMTRGHPAMVSSVARVLLSTEICENRLSKFLRNKTNKQTNKQKTNASENKTSMAEVIKQIMTMPVANVSLLLHFHFLLLFSVFNRVVFQRSLQISLRCLCRPYRPDALPSKYRRKYLVQLPVSLSQPCNKSLCWWCRTLSFISHLLTTHHSLTTPTTDIMFGWGCGA